MDAQRLKAQQATIEALKAQHERETEVAKREVPYMQYIHFSHVLTRICYLSQHLKKSSMARSLLNEREEEVRHLSAKVRHQSHPTRSPFLTLTYPRWVTQVAALNDEISSGAPSERRIFELA